MLGDVFLVTNCMRDNFFVVGLGLIELQMELRLRRSIYYRLEMWMATIKYDLFWT